MRVLHIVQNYYPSKGGTQILFKEISERLVKNYGDEVVVCTTNALYGPEKKFFNAIETKTETINGVKVIRFPFYRFHLPAFRLLHKLFVVLGIKTPAFVKEYIHGPWSPAMAKYINDFDGDVICGSSHNYQYMMQPLNKKVQKPFMYMGAIHFKEGKDHKPLGDKNIKAINQSSFYIANTIYEKQQLVNLNVDEHKIKVVGCGVELKAFDKEICNNTFRQKYALGHGKIVGFVGRHEPFKGIELLIDAMVRVWKDNADYNLIIAGSETAYTSVLKEKITNSGIEENKIRFITNFTDDEKADIYNNLDVFVSVSTEESFGIVYLEAWACKKPVIGADIGAVRSVINNGVNGYVVSANDTEALAIKIKELCENEHKNRLVGNNGYQKVVNQYTWDIITERYRSIYQQALDDAEVFN